MSETARWALFLALAVTPSAISQAQDGDLPEWSLLADGAAKSRVSIRNTLERTITALVFRSTTTRASDGRVMSEGTGYYDSAWGHIAPLKPGETWVSPSSLGTAAIDVASGSPSNAYNVKLVLVAVATDAPDTRGDPRFGRLIKQRRRAYYEAEGECIAVLASRRNSQPSLQELLTQFQTLQESPLATAGDQEVRRARRLVLGAAMETLRKRISAEPQSRLSDRELDLWLVEREKRRQRLESLLIP